MSITRETMQGWGWSEEAIEWHLESQALLDNMTPRIRGYYEGVFDAFAYENGAHADGLSRHVLPQEISSGDYDDAGHSPRFNYRAFLAVMDDLDDEGPIFLPGCTRVRRDYGDDVVFSLHCTESLRHSEPEDLTDVTWGYKESLAVWKEVFAT